MPDKKKNRRIDCELKLLNALLNHERLYSAQSKGAVLLLKLPLSFIVETKESSLGVGGELKWEQSASLWLWLAVWTGGDRGVNSVMGSLMFKGEEEMGYFGACMPCIRN